jgi:hypothetical protein
MAKLIYVMNTSLDGYISDRDGNLDWTDPTGEVFATITELVRPIGTYLYGGRMSETMAVCPRPARSLAPVPWLVRYRLHGSACGDPS